MFTTNDADLGADLDPDHRLLLRFVQNVDVRLQSRCCFSLTLIFARVRSPKSVLVETKAGNTCAYEFISALAIVCVCLGAATRRMLHNVQTSSIVRSCCFYPCSKVGVGHVCVVQVFAAFAQVAQQWCCVGGVHSALLLQLANRQHHESNSQGDGAHPEKSQRDPVRGAGRHQVRQSSIHAFQCFSRHVVRAFVFSSPGEC